MFPVAIKSFSALPVGQQSIDSSPLAAYLARAPLRRLGHFERIALLSAIKCLETVKNGKRAELPCLPERMGVVISTCYGPVDSTFAFLDSVMNNGYHLASPTSFSTSVYNILSSAITMNLAITGPAMTISQGIHSLGMAINLAGLWLNQNMVDYVLLGAVEQYSAYLNQLIAELDDSSIAPSQDVAFFMLLNSEARAKHFIARISQELRLTEEIKRMPAVLWEEEVSPCICPSGPVNSLLRALNRPSKGGIQSCGLAITGQGYSLIDISS
jgi:hypothetical protein